MTSGRRIVSPLQDFLKAEAAGGIVLVAATVVALVWANSPWKESYFELWHTQLSLGVGGHSIELDLQEWVNDFLMAIFFLVVGLEIKRELVEGELRDPRTAALPAIAALGGMAVPALLYLAWNAGHEGVDGWGIPMATDIAMAVGVVSLLGSRVVPSLKLFLLALAIVDDIGAIIVIALFYSDDFELAPFAVAVAIVGLIVVMRWAGIRLAPLYVVAGLALWLAVFQSGLHATLAGVALGLLAPARPLRQRGYVDESGSSVSVVEWLEHLLHPWASFLVVPLFALANAGIPITADSLSSAFHSRVTYGVVVGLVVGKFVGIVSASWIAVGLGVGTLPRGATWRGVCGVGVIAGIGFTVSIFIAGLAFPEAPVLENDAKIGILVASVVAALVGSLSLLRRTETSPR